jgi:hypothetical protein
MIAVLVTLAVASVVAVGWLIRSEWYQVREQAAAEAAATSAEPTAEPVGPPYSSLPPAPRPGRPYRIYRGGPVDWENGRPTQHRIGS